MVNDDPLHGAIGKTPNRSDWSNQRNKRNLEMATRLVVVPPRASPESWSRPWHHPCSDAPLLHTGAGPIGLAFHRAALIGRTDIPQLRDGVHYCVEAAFPAAAKPSYPHLFANLDLLRGL